MIQESSFRINFPYKGRQVSYTVYKMHISSYEVKDFYRIQATTGNRDLIKVDGRWIVQTGKPLPDDIVQLVGKAIEEVVG